MTATPSPAPTPTPVPPPDQVPLPRPGPASIAGLDAALPLTMFPVRLATRLHRPDPNGPVTQLWIRVFPDLIHADSHIPELSKQELTVATSYWDRIWRAATDPQRRNDAHSWAVSQLGAARTAWVVSATTPLNPGDAPTKPVADDEPLTQRPQLPKLLARTSSRPTLARLLPDAWHVTVRHSVEFVTRAWSKRVRPELAMAPSLADLPAGGGVRDLLRQHDLWWMVDFDEAVEAGMALRMPWNPPVGVPKCATEVVVFGVRGDNTGADTELSDLLDAHRFTTALEIVAPGTPTNNTDTVTAGFTETPADLDAYLARQTAPLTTDKGDRRPCRAARSSIPIPDKVPLGRDAAGSALGRALAITGDNPFERAEHAALLTGSWSSDMNRALWPATLDYLLNRALASAAGPAVADTDRAFVSAWCRDWVRAGGFLPSFRVGTQPYGVLPIALRPEQNALGAADLDRLSEVLLDLWDDWSSATLRVANFTGPIGGPPPTPEEEALRLAQVLGAVPNPTAFRFRPATVRQDEISDEWAAEIDELESLLAVSHDYLNRELYELTWKDEINDGDLTDQSYGLERLRAFADQMLDDEFYEWAWDGIRAVRDHIDTVLRAMTAAHLIRSETRQWDEAFSAAHLPTLDDPPLWYVEYGDDGAAEDGTFPPLRLVPDRSAAHIAGVLRDFAADARRTDQLPRPGYVATTAKSLFEKLLEWGVMNVEPDHAEQMALGLEGLATMLESGAIADPVGELTRLLRESLGLATHRFDAWLSSLANQRLATMRAARSTGVQLAGYGWVVNLEPDERAEPDSRGFIHAPSLDHAATAAVLRSAWLNYASTAADAPFGVDVSSDRVRRALWLIEGVRNGVDLAELLGARFERRLHDNGHPELIADVRRVVLDATGHTAESARSIVDGLALAVAYSESETSDPVRIAIDDWRATLPGFPNDGLTGPLRATVGDLDSTADLLTAQAVHSVIKGNLAEAAATLSVAGAGDAGMPPLRVSDVHRSSQLISHRVVAVLPAADVSNTSSVLASASPALAQWLADLLPAPDDVDLTVAFGDAAPGEVWSGSLGELGLTAIEMVALSAVDGNLSTGLLGQVAIARARAALGLDRSVPATITGNALVLAVAAGAARSLLGMARPLLGDDVAPIGGLAHVIDIAELDRRRETVASRLTELGAMPPRAEALLARFGDLAALDPGGLLAALMTPDESGWEALVATARTRAEQLASPLPDDWATLTPAAQAELLTERIQAALGVRVPLLPVTSLENQAELSTSLAASPQRVGSALNAMSWLLEAGRVHRGAGMCAELLDLVEVVNPAAPVGFQVAQLPHIAGEPWVAVGKPSAPGARLDLVFVTDAAAAIGAGPVCGLVLDAWTEPLPVGDATTGVAVHFDRPGAQPPQAVLLAMPPDEGEWTTEHIESLLIETMELVQVRAVGPETLDRFGHTLPAVSLAGGAVVEEIEGVAVS